MIIERTLNRRTWVATMLRAGAAALGVGVMASREAHAAKPQQVTVFKDPACGCCSKWVEHLRANGLALSVKDRTDMDAFKDTLGIPHALRSCHTAVAGKYLFEGHVPASDMKRFLDAPVANVIGLAVPGMPVGSPGMEQGSRRDRYDVVAFTARGQTRVYATHR